MSTPEDRVEQDTPVMPEPAELEQVPLEADAADATGQSTVVELDEDEHR